MTLRRIFALLAVIALVFAVTTPAEAQFGKLLNKAKKAAKEKVENKAREVKNKAEKGARDAVDDAVDRVFQVSPTKNPMDTTTKE